MAPDSEIELGDLDRVLAGDRAAADKMVAHLAPVIQRRVAGVLWRRAQRGGRAVSRQEVLDLAQDVFVLLLEKDGRVLRTWSPERGASLAGFVGIVAERYAVTVQRSGRKSGYKEDPTMDERVFEAASTVEDPEKILGDRQLLHVLLDRLREDLSPQGRRLFVLVYVEQRDLEEVANREGMTTNAVYLWRTRLKKRLRDLMQELNEAGPVALGGTR